MLTEGRVDDALSLIEAERRQDMKDADIAALERKVRSQWISDKLIQVRLSRLAGSKGDSIELLRKILKVENEWSMIPTGAVFATQAEESAYLSEFVQAGIYEALKSEHPLEAWSRFRQDRALLEDLLKVDTSRTKSAIVTAGNKFCKDEAKQLTETDFYGARFLKIACGEFQNDAAVPKTKNSVRLFRSLTPKIVLKNLPPERATDFSRDLKSEFEKSIWYDAAAADSLELTLAGPVNETIETQEVYRSKPYTVRVPYEEKSVRKKTGDADRSGLGTLFAVVAWALTSYVPDREVDNHDGTVTVYQTKYRDETRYFPYEAIEVTQTLSVDWKILLSPQAQAHAFEFKDQLRTISDEHSVSFPEAGLQPETRKIVRPTDWLLSLNRKLMDRIGFEFNTAWIERFCRTAPDAASDKISTSETFHRCVYGANGHAPSFVNEWFKKRYGIEIETWRQLALVHK